ncbi:unnamed protein product [Gadus morhua 'NCC']
MCYSTPCLGAPYNLSLDTALLIARSLLQGQCTDCGYTPPAHQRISEPPVPQLHDLHPPGLLRARRAGAPPPPPFSLGYRGLFKRPRQTPGDRITISHALHLANPHLGG